MKGTIREVVAGSKEGLALIAQERMRNFSVIAHIDHGALIGSIIWLCAIESINASIDRPN